MEAGPQGYLTLMLGICHPLGPPWKGSAQCHLQHETCLAKLSACKAIELKETVAIGGCPGEMSCQER